MSQGGLWATHNGLRHLREPGAQQAGNEDGVVDVEEGVDGRGEHLPTNTGGRTQKRRKARRRTGRPCRAAPQRHRPAAAAVRQGEAPVAEVADRDSLCARGETRRLPWARHGHLRTFTTPLTAASNASLRSAMAATCMAAAERRLGEECAACHAGGTSSVPALRDGAPGVCQGALRAQQALRHAAAAGDGDLEGPGRRLVVVVEAQGRTLDIDAGTRGWPGTQAAAAGDGSVAQRLPRELCVVSAPADPLPCARHRRRRRPR